MNTAMMNNGVSQNHSEENARNIKIEIEKSLKDLRINSGEAKRLEEIRRMSNVIQALENLIVQCEECEGVDELKNYANTILLKRKFRLFSLIHSK